MANLKDSSFRDFKQYPVIDRIQNAMKKHNIKEVTANDKKVIGEKCIKAFFDNPGHLYIRKATILEREGPVEVCMYPNHFVPVMDKIIIDHFQIKISNNGKQ